ncbi:MAG: hypothetical protein IKQ69_07480 [Oscillospiraceae bacterium]|nr:hypothetical protein [Oscillospiraceae bacterium]
MKKKDLRLYNVMFPVWMILWFPSWLWLLLIPANYLVDTLVLRWSLKGFADRGAFCKRHAWKICLAGFLSDFAGALLLFGVYAVSENPLSYAIAYAPFSHGLALLITVLSVALSGGCIYLLDEWLLKRAGLEQRLARHSALSLAVLTAPYLYFFPSGILYR